VFSDRGALDLGDCSAQASYCAPHVVSARKLEIKIASASPFHTHSGASAVAWCNLDDLVFDRSKREFRRD
jgi:hypothetical protein